MDNELASLKIAAFLSHHRFLFFPYWAFLKKSSSLPPLLNFPSGFRRRRRYPSFFFFFQHLQDIQSHLCPWLFFLTTSSLRIFLNSPKPPRHSIINNIGGEKKKKKTDVFHHLPILTQQSDGNRSLREAKVAPSPPVQSLLISQVFLQDPHSAERPFKKRLRSPGKVSATAGERSSSTLSLITI